MVGGHEPGGGCDRPSDLVVAAMKFMGWLTCALAVACYLIGLADMYTGEHWAGFIAFTASVSNAWWWYEFGRRK